MFLIIVLGNLVVQIPMPVLVGIMIMVSIGTFDWSSFTYLRKAPKADAFVMLATVVIVVATHDLSIGVIAGVILSALFFVAKVSKINVKQRSEAGKTVYTVKGPLFFASVDHFIASFDYEMNEQDILIDFGSTQIWDDSAVGAIDKVMLRLMENQNNVEMIGLNPESKKLVDRLASHNDPTPKISTH